jgi:hypothetical protein
MPLAIELAAARLRSMSLAELSERLDQRFQLLSVRTGDPRHRTLEAVVDWSFSQLDDMTGRFFCMLSVFAGDFTAEAAAAVTGHDELAALDRLDRLVDRSLIIASRREEVTAFRLLETLRQYGRDHLGEEDWLAAAGRHGDHYAAVARRCMEQLRRGDDDAAISGIIASWDNIREAVHHAVGRQNADLTLRLVTPLSAYMYLRPDPEVAEWASAALALPGAADHRLALWAHIMLAQIGYTLLDLVGAEPHARRALRIIEDQGLRPLARPHLALGYALTSQGRFDEAATAFASAAGIAREHGTPVDLIEGLHGCVLVDIYAGRRWESADTDELTELYASTDSSRGKAMAAAAIGLTGFLDGASDGTETLAEAGRLAGVEGLDVVEGTYRAWARIAASSGSARGVLAGMVEVLDCHGRSRLPWALRGNLSTFARSLSALGRHRTVAVIEGGAMPTSIFPQRTAEAFLRARHELGSAAYDAAVAEGRAMTDEELAEYLRIELEALGVAQ